MTRAIAPYKPLPWQIQPWRDKSPILLLTGSAGGGKSRLAAEKLHAYLMKYPGATGVMLRKTRESMTNSTVLSFERTTVGRDPRVSHKKADHRFEYANGSILAYGGMKDEAQREQIRGVGLDGSVDFVWMEEAVRFTEDDFHEVLARMRGRAAPWTQVIVSTNPGPPSHWINQRLIIKGEAAVYKSSALDNPYSTAQYLESLDMLTGILRQRLRDGLWVQAEGIVYDNFEMDNLTDEGPDPNLPFELAFDDGYVDPRAILFIQRQPDKVLVFDELYHSRYLEEKSVEAVVERCVERYGLDESGRPNKLPEIAVGSPEANQLKERFRRADIVARSKPHEVVEGIKVVRELICDGNGRRMLQIHRQNCPNFIREITEGYRYPEEGARRDNEKPLDGNDHACDAFRYWAYLRIGKWIAPSEQLEQQPSG